MTRAGPGPGLGDGSTKIHELPVLVLVGVLAIDRDLEQVERVFEGIRCLSRFCRWDLLVVTREQDVVARETWSRNGATVVTVPDYPIEKRHNLWKIAEKRNLVRERGRASGYDAVFFVDSDIIVGEEALSDLYECSQYADIVVVPYKIRWSNEYTVGIIVEGKSRFIDFRDLIRQTRYPRIHGGPMGCTLIRRSALDVPFVPMQLGKVAGEDIGFFYQVYRDRPDLVVRTTSWPFVAEHVF